MVDEKGQLQFLKRTSAERVAGAASADTSRNWKRPGIPFRVCGFTVSNHGSVVGQLATNTRERTSHTALVPPNSAIGENGKGQFSQI